MVPVPIPEPQPLPLPPTPPRPRAPPRSAPAPNPATSFPHPMFNSLGNSFAGVPQGQRDVARSGGTALQPFTQTSGTPLGAGWNQLLHEWLERHKYYPEQAAQLGQQGEVTVAMTIQSDGHVTDLRLIGRSGSPWLDMGLQSIFRDAHVPPFPPGTTETSINMTVRMDYSLISH
jgi:protein TonB